MISVFLFTIVLFIFSALFYVVFVINVLLCGGHDLPTSWEARDKIGEIIEDYGKEKGKFYDLGCGRGHVLAAVKKRFPKMEVTGIEKRPLQILFARLRVLLAGEEIHLERANLFEIELKEADVVYTHLWWDLMPPLERKLKRELEGGALVITNTSHFLDWEAEETRLSHSRQPEFEKLFVYRMKER